jgi:hypothetical protein
MNGKIDVELGDFDQDGSPDVKVTITVGKAVLLGVIAAVSSALGYSIL